MCLVEHAGNKPKLLSTSTQNKQASRYLSTSCSNHKSNLSYNNIDCSYSNNSGVVVVSDINTQQQQQQQQYQYQSLHCDSTTPTFNAKYRRKCFLLLSLLLFHGCFSGLHSASAYNCTTNPCQNEGQCLDGQCICADGWQGPACQFCGGKVR